MLPEEAKELTSSIITKKLDVSPEVFNVPVTDALAPAVAAVTAV